MKQRNYTTKELFRRFLPYYGNHKLTLAMDMFCAGLTTVCEIVLPLIMSNITNTAQYNPAPRLLLNISACLH